MGITQRRFLLPGFVILFCLVGCGNNTGSGTTGNQSSAYSVTQQAGSGNNMRNSTPNTQPPTYPVTLQVAMASYSPGDTIRVTITNQSGKTIYFADHRTNCTVLLLERQGATSWEPVALCKLMIATRIHSLKTGDSSAVTLVSSSQWPTGTYRARLDYSDTMNAGGNTLTTVTSMNFRLG